MANRHTIILMQTSQNRATRTFMDYESITQAMDGICALYERKLKELNPAIRNLSYDITDLYNFIDGLADMSALVYVSLSLTLKNHVHKYFINLVRVFYLIFICKAVTASLIFQKRKMR
ncbi:Enhancer of rudimentary-like [Spatholobus suberectus]|nr:Enhancer of rudimentary-like [Spatholobus suberectus]